jgi:tetratricopeptide (TPR) repeat protein
MAAFLRFQAAAVRKCGTRSLLKRIEAASADFNFFKPFFAFHARPLPRAFSTSPPPNAASHSTASATVPASSSAASPKAAPPTSGGPVPGETDPEALAIQSLLRRVHELYARAEFAEALPIAKEARRRAFHHFGSPSPVFASCVNNHALLLKALGSLDEAANLFDLALLNYEAGVGTRHASYLTCLGNMGAVHLARHKHEEARAVFDRVLTARRELLPADHPEVAQAMYQLAGALRHLKRFEEAFALQSEALRNLQRKYGSEHLLSATAMNNLALTCKALAQQDQQQPPPSSHAAATAADADAAPTPTPPLSAKAAAWLQQARDLLESACSVRHRALGARHPDYIAAVYNLQEVYRACGETERAERVRAHILSIFPEEEGQPSATAAESASQPSPK